MRILIIFFILLLNNSLLFSQKNAPEVTNVTFSQHSDGSFIVDVYYDLNDADGDTMSVLMLVSDDAGLSWNFSCDSITGDFDRNILGGSGKHIVWDFGSEHPETYGDQFRVKIIADDYNFDKGKVTDIDGNVYQTVKIGNQWWMAENLKVTHYRSGQAIPNVTDGLEWANLSNGAYCCYNNVNSNIATYGLLYNGFAAADSHNIAPAGWHVPTDEEWKELEMYLGMSQSEADATYWRGTDEGGKLKESGTTHWASPNTGDTNESGFTALPGGSRYSSVGYFYYIGDGGYWWSASSFNATTAWHRVLSYDKAQVHRSFYGKQLGSSVRCIRD
jgi:uncharacterized protein (TIGR02145 family)